MRRDTRGALPRLRGRCEQGDIVYARPSSVYALYRVPGDRYPVLETRYLRISICSDRD